MVGCGKSGTSGNSTGASVAGSVQSGQRTVATVKAKFEANGYTVTSSTQMGVSVLIAAKGADMITVSFFPDVATATSSLPTYQSAASAVGQTCKRDGAIIYYGTASAVAIYDQLL